MYNHSLFKCCRWSSFPVKVQIDHKRSESVAALHTELMLTCAFEAP